MVILIWKQGKPILNKAKLYMIIVGWIVSPQNSSSPELEKVTFFGSYFWKDFWKKSLQIYEIILDYDGPKSKDWHP